jgi:hypothetical protein
VKVYVADDVLLIVAGDHVPVIPFVDVPGNPGTPPPSHMVSDVPKLKVGVTFAWMVTVKVAVVAH